jgi:hypothetical protein
MKKTAKKAKKFSRPSAKKPAKKRIIVKGAQRLKIEHNRTIKKLNARVDKTFAHVDGSPHAVTGPAGCVACARRRNDARKQPALFDEEHLAPQADGNAPIPYRTGEKNTSAHVIYFTPDEHARVRIVAKREGMNVVQFVRQLVRSDARVKACNVNEALEAGVLS